MLYEMEKAYAGTVWELPDDYLSFERYRLALYGLDMTSSPGIPYIYSSPSIGSWLGYDGLEFDEYKVRSLWHDVLAVLNGDYDMVLRVFIKQEPHSIAKAVEGRWRLIVASPLCVQVVWQMLFKYQNDLEIQKCYDIPSQQGIIMVRGGWKTYLESWKARGFNTGLDKRSWDWTVPGWALDLDVQFRYRMGRGTKMSEWLGTAVRMYKDMFDHPVLRLSNGMEFRQEYPGIMKSGCVNTISTNSHMQVMIHLLACWDQGVSHVPLCEECGGR